MKKTRRQKSRVRVPLKVRETQEKYFFNLIGVEMIGKSKFPSFQPLFCEKTLSTEDEEEKEHNKGHPDPKARVKRPGI